MPLKSCIPFPVAPYLIASPTYNVRGILIGLARMVAKLDVLKQACIIFLNSVPTVNRSCFIHQNSVFRVERGQTGGIAVVAGLVSLFSECVLQKPPDSSR